MRSRLAAWLVTGPLGHGYAAILDIASVLWTLARRRVGGHPARRARR